VLAHAPFDRVGPLVVGLVMAPMMSFMWAFIAGTMSHAKQTAGRPADDEAAAGRWDAWRAKISPLTEQAGLPAPSKLTVRGGSAVQAMAGGSPSDYELVVHGGMDHFPADQQEAVLRHELGHVKHYDSWSTAAQMFLATIGPMTAVMAGAISDARTWLALPLLAATVPLWFASKRMDEYHADQHAAHAQGSAAPLIRFFVSDSDDREDALRAAEGLPPAPKPFWRRSWTALKGVVAGHPSHEKRIARLRALSGPRP
jgi:Zn-dependent protease with chaperone function